MHNAMNVVKTATNTKTDIQPQQQPKQQQVSGFQALITRPDVIERFSQTLKEQAPAFIQSLITIVNTNPALKACDSNSIVACAFAASTLKLPLSPQLGYISFVSFGNKCTLSVGYKGLIQLAMRGGQIKHFNLGEVFEGETVIEDRMTGEINITGNKTSKTPIGFFIYIETIGGFRKTIYKTQEELTEHGLFYTKNKGANSLWRNQRENPKMCKKTLVRMIMSYLLLSPETATVFAQAMVADEKSVILNGNNELEFSYAEEEEQGIVDIEISTETEPIGRD